MVLSLGLSDVSSWLDTVYSFCQEYHRNNIMSFSVHHIRRYMSICHIHSNADLLITWWKWSWPDFSTVKSLFFLKLQRIFETMQNTLFLIILSPTTFMLAFGLPSSHWSNEVRGWTVDSRIFTLKDPFLIPSDMNLIFWNILNSIFWIAFLKVYMTHFPITHSSDMSTALYTHKGRDCWPHHWSNAQIQWQR